MATGTMVTAAGAAMFLYYVLSRRLAQKDDDDDRNGELSKSSRSGRRRIVRRPAQAPATWFEAITTLSETLRFTYAETLGKWPIGDLAFGINYLIRRQGNVQVASVYAGNDSVQLKGPEIRAELTYLLRLLNLCMLFSKKPFPVFLELGGYSQEDVLLQEPKAGLLKPAFTILCDRSSKCFLLLIRGTHSIKDTLTAATGAVVPFHHSVLHEGGVSNLVLGYAHCGMVAAARWIAKCCSPCLLQALEEFPEYKVKIVGHSLGGGTALQSITKTYPKMAGRQVAAAIFDLNAVQVLRRKAAPFSAVLPDSTAGTPKRRTSITLETIAEEESPDFQTVSSNECPISSYSPSYSPSLCFSEARNALLNFKYKHAP